MLPVLLASLDLLGVAVFAATGALTASRKQMDLVGFVVLGVVTGVGGGTVRDMALGLAPVFWVREPVYLLVCVGASVLTYFTAHMPDSRLRVLIWLDAVGMALFAVLGAEKALAFGPVVAAAMGVVTAVLGGMIRDILGGESPVILRREIYATAALLGAVVFVAATPLLPRDAALLAGLFAGFGLRALAIRFGWSLPRWRPRPGRTPDEVGL